MSYLSDIDIDITLHLGNIRNIDLLSRGIYSLKISLVYGILEQKILPIGLFSAPSHLEAYVRDIRVPSPSQFTNCTIDGDSNSFISRTFVVRYKDENHELNEGVHWRLTLPNCDLSDFQRSTTDDYIICSDPLIFRFELLFCELLEHDGNADLTNCIDDFLPTDPILQTVSVQELQIQQASTGFHHFFPIKFDRTHFIFLDCMIHSAITAIRYKNISLDVFQSPFLSKANTPRVQFINKQNQQKLDENGVNIGNDNNQDDNQDFDAITSGTWYEPDVQTSGPVINEQYYENKSITDSSSSTTTTTNNRAIDRPVRKSFKTPPTTIISPTSRTQQGLLSPYLKLSDKINDLTLNFPTQFNISTGFSNNSKNSETLSSTTSQIDQNTSSFKESNNNNNDNNDNNDNINNNKNDIEEENRVAFSLPSNRIVSASGLDRSDIEKLFKTYSRPLICNHHMLRDGTQMIIDLFNKWNQQEISKYKKFQPRNSLDFLSDPNFGCFLETNEKEIIDSLMIEESISEVYYGISQYLEKCNLEMYGRWSLVLSSLPKIMKEVSEQLRGKYVHGMRAFWKGQCLLFSCSESFMKKPNQDYAATNELAILLSQLQKEVRLSSSTTLSSSSLNNNNNNNNNTSLNSPSPSSSSSSTNTNIIGSNSNSNISNLPPTVRSIEVIKGSSNNNQSTPREILSPTLRPSVKARGLPIFDRSIHLVPSKLPVMLIQQYESNNNSNNNPTGNSNKMVVINGNIISGDEMLYERGGVLKSYSCDIHMNSLSNVWNPSSINVGYTGFDPCLSSFQLVDHSSQPVHLIVLQHGFQGSSFDMRLIRNTLHVEFPHYLFLIATSNEADSGQSLKVMARNLVEEILEFCREKCPAMIYDPKYKGRVSFIGHSVGGLIIRKCLESPELQILYNKLHLYISLASPHLGTLYAESQLVSTGMWALLKWKKSPILQELSLKDSSDYHSTELFSLSQNGVLQYFRHIIFVSSPKDLYVPEYSSRVQINNKAILNPYVGYTLTTMAANMISQIDSEKLIRITLDNNVNDSGNVDKVIGRAAHICYLDQMVIVESLVYSLYTIFRLT